MLTVRTGLPHPDLERALRERLEKHAAGRDFSRLAVIVPSREARRHLRLLIGREWGLTCLGLRLSTAYDFALNVLSGAPDRPAHMSPDGLLAVLVRELAAGRGYPRLSAVASTHGGPGAVLRTLHALREAGVPPAKPGRKAPEILRLYAEFEARRAGLHLSVPADIVSAAAAAAGASPFAAGFSEIIYWGFYDMTGVQLELLSALAAIKPVSFLLPRGAGPAWSFARGFGRRLEEELGAELEESGPEGPRPPLEAATERLFDPASEAADGAELRAISVSGTEAELRAAVREVLRLGEEKQIDFDQVAVVARSLDAYVPYIEEVFDEYRVPFRCSSGASGAAFPAVKAVHALMRVIENDFARADVLDLFSSPFFKAADFGAQREWIPGWDALTRKWGVVGGTDWERLAGPARGEGAAEGNVDPLAEPKRVKALLKCVDSLRRAAGRIPVRGSWEQLGDGFLEAFGAHLDLAGEAPGDPSAESGAEVRRLVQGMRDFGVVGTEAERGEFFDALRDRLAALSVPVGCGDVAAVEVLDAMALRCRSFRAVVLIGAHQGAFPRQVRQDPFMSDAQRARIEKKHDLHLPRRAAGHEEERLLFALVLSAAREELTVIRQRSDDEGKPLVPSWYLQELLRATGRKLEEHEALVPRRLQGQFSDAGNPWRRWFSPREWLRGLVLRGERGKQAWKLLAADPSGLERALRAGDALAEPGTSLGQRDGVVETPDGFPSQEMIERGFSASFLQDYVRCPFQFFARRVLALDPLEDPEAVQEIGSLERGQVLHKALEYFFAELRAKGHFGGKKLDAKKLLRKCFDRAASGFARRNSVGWPLSWQVALEGLAELAGLYVSGELTRLADSEFEPAEAEKNASAPAPRSIKAPARFKPLRLFGRIDRLDEGKVDGKRERRIVDYKFKSGRNVNTNLVQQAVRGETLQPPIYVLLAKASAKGKCKASAEFHYLAPNWPKGPCSAAAFPGDCWEQPVGAQIAELIAAVLQGVEVGNYFVLPGRHCDYCDFGSLCRKSHRPTRYRHAADARPRILEAFATAKPEKKSAAKKSTGKTSRRKGGRR